MWGAYICVCVSMDSLDLPLKKRAEVIDDELTFISIEYSAIAKEQCSVYILE